MTPRTDTKLSGAPSLALTRVFNAPRALVFAAWTDPKHLSQWWGPNGFTNPVCEVDARPGGAILIHMRSPEGDVFPMKGVFHEVVAPERIVFTSTAFDDDSGEPGIEAHNTVTFTERDGRTQVALEVVVTRSKPEFAGALDGMEEGWSQSLERLTCLLSGMMSMRTEPQEGHAWLQRLVGEWACESQEMMSDDSPECGQWTETVRSLGGLWVVAEGSGQMPDGDPATTVMTLGYDPAKRRYVGTWVGSMMSHLWVYDGELDADGRVLTLSAEGPDMSSAEGKMAQYRDVIEFVTDDRRTLTSHMLAEDGTWHQFMSVTYRRKIA